MTNHLWQSTVFAIAVGVLTAVLRKNRAQVRFWLWFTASTKFLVPFALLIALGSHLQWTSAPKVAAPAVTSAMEQITEPFSVTLPQAPSMQGGRDWAPIAMLAVWACGFAAVVLMRFRAWLRIRAAVRSSARVNLAADVEIRSAPGLLEPGVVGILRPILLLPEGIAERLTPLELEAVLAHELCHVRRRDNLLSSIHMFVEAVFWFHPLVWWIGARLLLERERACDEEVLRLGNQASIYAQGILNVCKLYAESPLACVSGVTGSDLKKRIEAIMNYRMSKSLSLTRQMLLAAAGAAALALPIVVGLLRAQSSPPAPKFDVISIKPCKGEPAPVPGRKTNRGGRLTPSPGRLTAECANLATLVRAAYIQYADGQPLHFISPRVFGQEIKGRPSWYDSDRWTIEATTQGPQVREILMGPMLQGLLEDRFQLKIHRETRELPIYELRVAKGGTKFQPAKAGSCQVVDRDHPPPRDIGPDTKPICGGFWGDAMYGTTMENLSRQLTATLDRDVVDKTGLAGEFDLHFTFPPPDLTPASPDGPPDPAARANNRLATNMEYAIPRLGLILQPAKGSGEFLVIDQVEKPAEN